MSWDRRLISFLVLSVGLRMHGIGPLNYTSRNCLWISACGFDSDRRDVGGLLRAKKCSSTHSVWWQVKQPQARLYFIAVFLWWGNLGFGWPVSDLSLNQPRPVAWLSSHHAKKVAYYRPLQYFRHGFRVSILRVRPLKSYRTSYLVTAQGCLRYSW